MEWVKRNINENATTLLVILYVLLGEVHNLFNDDPDKKVNLILAAYRPMTWAWNVKYICWEEMLIISWFTIRFYKCNRVNFTTYKAILAYFILDQIMYFYNYKTGYFGSVYIWMIFIWLGMYFYRGMDKRLGSQKYLSQKKQLL